MDEFLEKIHKHRDEFYRYVYRNVWDSGKADDVFSAAVTAAYENRHKYTPHSNFRAWMFRILTNKCFVANRETLRTPEPLDGVNEPAETPGEKAYGDLTRDPSAFLEECGEEVYRAMRKLRTVERSCLLLRAVERFSYKEIAAILGIPKGTVMTHLARGRAKLRAELAEYAERAGVTRGKGPRLLTRTAAARSENQAARGGPASM